MGLFSPEKLDEAREKGIDLERGTNVGRLGRDRTVFMFEIYFPLRCQKAFEEA